MSIQFGDKYAEFQLAVFDKAPEFSAIFARLPQGLTDFSFDAETGVFSMHYAKKIEGRVLEDNIELQNVSVIFHEKVTGKWDSKSATLHFDHGCFEVDVPLLRPAIRRMSCKDGVFEVTGRIGYSLVGKDVSFQKEAVALSFISIVWNRVMPDSEASSTEESGASSIEDTPPATD